MWTSLTGRFGRRRSSRFKAAEGRRARSVGLVAILVLCLPQRLAGGEKEVVARWEELAPLVERRDVEAVLANGVYVRGRALKVLPEALEVEVKKTSDAAVVPKGKTRIPRELLTVLRVRWKKRLARAVLTPAMYVGGGFVLALFHIGGEELSGIKGSAAAVALAAGGYLIGDRIDTKWMRITIFEPIRFPQAEVQGEQTIGRTELGGIAVCTR